ncbi:MAG: radical SAM protein [Desulfobulbaceae bacterium A2]|nr:MAG: radical SAM protein [Desulfobulbaceae bacterium A2]
MDKYLIDSHKLHFHPRRVADWLQGDNIAPVYMEISPSGACNHRCVFCGLDFMGYKPRFLPTDIVRERLSELGAMGLKSLMFAGEGEPLLHRDICAMAEHAHGCGIDLAFTTNGVLLREDKIARLLPVTQWIKVSCNAGSAATYAAIHRTKAADFDQVFHNLAAAAELRRRDALACVLGLQALLLPENRGEMVDLALRCRDLGLDYLVIKPYSQHPQGDSRRYQDICYQAENALESALADLNTPAFHVVFRSETMQRWDEGQREYRRCLALPFWSYVDAGGNVWGCSVYLGDERFLYGNILTQSFREIWEGARRRESLRWVEQELDPSVCRVNCRMDKINTYLWGLRHPPDHVNFI